MKYVLQEKGYTVIFGDYDSFEEAKNCALGLSVENNKTFFILERIGKTIPPYTEGIYVSLKYSEIDSHRDIPVIVGD